MKALAVCLLVVIVAPFNLSQEPSSSQTSPDLIVLKQSWDEQVTFRVRDSAPYSADRRRAQGPYLPDSLSTKHLPVVKQFVYKARVKNTGSREIQAVSWDYVFTDSGTQKEVARHKFHSREKVRPGEEATIEGGSASPPSKVVSVAALIKDAQNPFTESIMLKCISYSDGTVWKHPSFTEDCQPDQ